MPTHRVRLPFNPARPDLIVIGNYYTWHANDYYNAGFEAAAAAAGVPVIKLTGGYASGEPKGFLEMTLRCGWRVATAPPLARPVRGFGRLRTPSSQHAS